jgi:hypothetical protein
MIIRQNRDTASPRRFPRFNFFIHLPKKRFDYYHLLPKFLDINGFLFIIESSFQ